MSLFLKEESFCEYLQHTYPEKLFTLGHAVISVNVIHFTPIMSCVYLTEEYIAAAKYNRQLQIFTDHVLFEKKQIKEIRYTKKGLSGILTVQTTEKLADNQYVTLRLTLSDVSGTAWHKKNLQQIKKRYQ